MNDNESSVNRPNEPNLEGKTPLEKKELLLSLFSPDDKEKVLLAFEKIKDENLSLDSIYDVLKELDSFGTVGSGVISTARSNYDLRNKLNRERKLVLLFVLTNIITILIVFVLIYAFSSYPKYSVVQTVDNSVLCELKPENNPILTDTAIEDFAKQATLSAYSFDYVNYRDHLSSVTNRYFTSKGRELFNTALRDSKSLAYIRDNRLTMRSMALSVPQIENKGFTSNGKPYWVVRMPIQTEFYTGGKKPEDVQRFVATIRIETSNRDAFNAKGIGISSLVLSPYRGQP